MLQLLPPCASPLILKSWMTGARRMKSAMAFITSSVRSTTFCEITGTFCRQMHVDVIGVELRPLERKVRHWLPLSLFSIFLFAGSDARGRRRRPAVHAPRL